MNKAIFKGWRQYGYYEWLIEQVNSQISETHTMLLDKLHNIPFTWKIRMDENRANDGMNLRYIYLEEAGIVDESIDNEYFSSYGYDCSVLEMLIALTRRFSKDVVGESFMTCADYFWVIIENLDLIRYTDKHFDEDEVDDKIYIFLNRLYNKDGEGGAFPLNETKSNQRNVEIWYQMCEWFNEKYWQEGWF